jgi:hypothetical protein
MHLTYATERIFNLRSQQGTCRGPLPLRKPASAGSLQSALPVQRNLHAPYFTDECPAIDLQLLSRKIFLNARRSSALEILEISPRILSFPSCNDVDSSGFHSSGWDRRPLHCLRTSGSDYPMTQRHPPRESNLQLHCCKNFTTLNMIFYINVTFLYRPFNNGDLGSYNCLKRMLE